MKLRNSLVALAAAIALPLTLLVTSVGYVFVEHQKDTFRRGALDRNRAFMAAVDSDLRGNIAALTSLATSPNLQSADLAAYNDEATRVLRSQPDWRTILLTDTQGQQLVNTAAAQGTSLPVAAEMESLRRVVETRMPTVGRLYLDPISRQHLIPIRVPVVRDNELAYVLTATVGPQHYADLLHTQNLPSTWASGLVDSHGFFIARVPYRPPTVRASSGFLAAVANADEGWYRGFTVDGNETYTAHLTSKLSGWSIGYAIPTEEVYAAAYRAAWILGVGTATTLIVAALLALAIGRRISRPMYAIANVAKRLSDPDIRIPPEVRGATIDEVRVVGDALEEGASAIRERQLLQRREAQTLREAAQEQERLLTAATRAHQRLETMFHGSLVGHVTWRIDGTLTGANDAFLASVGYGKSDIEHGAIALPQITPLEFSAIDAAKLEELRNNRFHTPYEKEFIRRDGSRVSVLVASAFFPDSNEEGISHIVDLEDVKRAEREARELLRKVTESEKKLREADERKDIYLATLAHELRNPLSPIRNAVAILRISGPFPQQADWALELIERQTTQMARLLDDLLEVSRIAQGKLELRRTVLDLREVLREVFDSLTHTFNAGDHRAEINVADTPLWLEGDHVRLAQIFHNLLLNAGKYTERGGHILLTAQRTGSDAVVTVSDSGMGIEPELLERLFEPFTQSQRTRHRAQGGLGIGLALVKGLVELHGGNVAASSAGIGQGATFVVQLPLWHASDFNGDERERDPPTRTGWPPGRTVLVVDDNRDAADSLAHLLLQIGARCDVVYDGFAALRAIESQRPSVVIMDIGMPDMSGYEVARRIRKDNGRPLLIALSGWGQETDRNAALEAGFDLHYTKPVDPDDLFQAIEDYANAVEAPDKGVNAGQ